MVRQLANRSPVIHSRLVGLALAAVGWASACTPFEPGSDELSEPLASTAELGRDWSCLRGEPEPEALIVRAENGLRSVHSMQLLGIATGLALPGLRARACEQRDLDCASPLTEEIAVSREGWVDLPLYGGFDGFIEVFGEAIVPTLLFFSEPLGDGGRQEHTPIAVMERAALPTLSRGVGILQEENLGLVYERAFDCRLDDARGLAYSIDRAGVPWYFVDGLPSGMAVETAESGLGGFINVEAGVAVLTTELRGVGQIGAEQSVVVRAGWITGLRFFPTFAPAQPIAD